MPRAVVRAAEAVLLPNARAAVAVAAGAAHRAAAGAATLRVAAGAQHGQTRSDQEVVEVAS